MTPQPPEPPADIVHRFEEAWRGGQPPRLDSFLPAAADTGARLLVLRELVAIDLEYRWRLAEAAGGNSWIVEDYVRHFPELGPLQDLPIELIVEEYRVRHRWGDAPSADVYLRRFPARATVLPDLIQQVDTELSAERARRPRSPGPTTDRRVSRSASPDATCRIVKPSQPVVAVSANDGKTTSDHLSRPSVVPRIAASQMSAASLLDALRQTGLLTAEQIDEVLGGSLERFADATSLAAELLKRGWLTAYQANQLLQGRGQSLILGHYRLLERLGEGGAGQVFKARHQNLGRLVALKVLHEELLSDAESVGRFLREIQLVSQLNHPNLIQAYDAGPVGTSYFLAMKYVEGTDLGRLVKRGGPLLVGLACEYIRQAALGLQHLHDHGLVHRDIKPHNLMIGRDGIVQVADLGLARGRPGEHTEVFSARSTGTLTPLGAGTMGTTDYLAPEQAIDFHAADIRADIYSLGCTFWYLLIGQPPFPSRSLAETLLSHQMREPPALEQLRSDVPAAVAATLRRMLAKRPEDRFATPAEVADAVAPYSSATGAALPDVDFEPSAVSVRSRVHTTWQMLRSFARQNKVFTASFATGLATAVILLTWSSVVNYRERLKTEAAYRQTEKAYAQYRNEQREKEQLTRHALSALVDSADLAARNGKFADALQQVDLAANLDPEYLPACFLKAQLLIAHLDVVPARAELNRYLQARPADKPANRLLYFCNNPYPNDFRWLTDIDDVLRNQNALGPSAVLRPAILKSASTNKQRLRFCQDQINDHWPGTGPLLKLDGGGLKFHVPSNLDAGIRRNMRTLEALRNIPLDEIDLESCSVRDLSALRGMPIVRAVFQKCADLHDIEPLRGMPLRHLSLKATDVRDLTPLEGCQLHQLFLPKRVDCGMTVLRGMKSLARINGMPAKQFWQDYDAGKFKQQYKD